MKWLFENWGTVLSICTLFVSIIIALYKAFGNIKKNTADIAKLREDLDKEKNQNKENYNKLQDLIKDSINTALAPLLVELNKIQDMNENMHVVKEDIGVMKNDISSIKDRLDKLEDKAF